MWELWFILFVLFVLKMIEDITPLYFSLSFSSLLTTFYTFYNHALSSSLTFFAITLMLIYLISHYLFPFIKNKTHLSSSQPASLRHLIGQKGSVYYPIGSSSLRSGTIRLDGETWRALSYTHRPIPTGTRIKVQGIKGVHLIVSPVESKITKKR